MQLQPAKLIFKRIDETLPVPEYQTSGAVGFDLYARETTTINPGQVTLIPSNLIFVIPKGYVLLINSRSSTARKKGLLIPMGVIDNDYCGPEDEVKIQTYNFTNEPVTIETGERFAQALLMPILTPTLFEGNVGKKSRGGFGTTGQ